MCEKAGSKNVIGPDLCRVRGVNRLHFLNLTGIYKLPDSDKLLVFSGDPQHFISGGPQEVLILTNKLVFELLYEAPEIGRIGEESDAKSVPAINSCLNISGIHKHFHFYAAACGFNC